MRLPGWAVRSAPPGPKVCQPSEGTLVHKALYILGLSPDHPAVACAKLKQCVVLACFVLYKNRPSLPYPYVLNIYINFYLNSKLEILFTLISLFSQKHTPPLIGYKCSPKLVCVTVFRREEGEE